MKGAAAELSRPGLSKSKSCVVFISGVLIAATMLAPSVALARHRHPRTHTADRRATHGTGAVQPYEAAVLMEPSTDTIIFEKNAHEQWPTASLAKMMIALIVAERLDNGSLKLTNQVTTSRRAAKMGGSQVYLKEGETFSLDDMMKAVMVHSANDASVAVAEYIAGSTEAFVQLMNQRAEALGMKDTHYYSVEGLPPGPGESADLSSAYDCAILARELLKHPQVIRWASIDNAPFRGGAFNLRNTNHLVRTFPGCDGLKTGFYYKAGFNVVATAHRGGMRVVAVVLGSPRKQENFKAAAELMSQAFVDYEMRYVARKDAAIAREIVVNGGIVGNFKPGWGDDLGLLLKRDSRAQYHIQYDLPQSIAAPIKAGQMIGKGELIADGKAMHSAPLLAPAAIAVRPSLFHRLLGSL